MPKSEDNKPTEKRQRKNRYKSYAWTHPKTKKLYARVQIRDDDGKINTYYKPATNKKHADQLAKEMLDDHSVRKTGFIEGEAMTFSDLAEWYKEKYCVPPVYSDAGEKVGGMRTHRTVKNRVDYLKTHFGKFLIKNIDEDVIYRFKRKREKENLKTASINRDLEILRAMFRKAVRRRWLRESPFDYGENLIEKALERRREVTLTKDEETVLLECARRSDSPLLYYALVCLLDTGARPSEIYDASTVKAEPVRWRDFFDHDFKTVRLTSYKGKKKLVRFAPVSDRLEAAMMNLWNSVKETERDVNAQIFPVGSFKTSWNKVRAKADLFLKIAKIEKMKLEDIFALAPDEFTEIKTRVEQKIAAMEKKPAMFDVRLRDLRRNFRTKLSKAGMNDSLVQKILGHENLDTTFDYLQADREATDMAKLILDNEHGRVVETKSDNN